MVKDLFIGIAFFAHHGGSDLAEAHTVAPAGPRRMIFPGMPSFTSS